MLGGNVHPLMKNTHDQYSAGLGQVNYKMLFVSVDTYGWNNIDSLSCDRRCLRQVRNFIVHTQEVAIALLLARDFSV